jgi:hypothetical protein
MIRSVAATRYVTPLREGGSLPAIVEGDDLGTYVAKFRGAGQGKGALLAELLAGEIGRALGLPVPEIVFLEIDAGLGRNEPDSEIRALIQASLGQNLGLDYLPGALAFDPAAVRTAGARPVDPLLASRIVWFDAFLFNIDRTARNTNMLVWHGQPWLIDHGAALYFQHSTTDYRSRSRSAFPAIRDHVLLGLASELEAADALAHQRLDRARLEALVALIPAAWLEGEDDERPARREALLDHLVDRLAGSAAFVEEARRARQERV